MLVIGNWKMNGDASAATKWCETVAAQVLSADTAVCPPAPLLPLMQQALSGSKTATGGQDCSPNLSGAFTGDTSAALLKDIGCTYVIVGHSERRALHGEHDDVVCAKAITALEAGLTPVICIGELLEQRQKDETETVLAQQLSGSVPDAGDCVIAYEPVWAIGTGVVATEEQVAQTHSFIRGWLAENRPHLKTAKILYGGSVKPNNAAGIFAQDNVDGALVGGASLQPQDFCAIANAA